MKFISKYILFLILAAAGIASTAHASPLTIDSKSNKDTISLSVGKANPYKAFIVGNPDRLVVDVPAQSSRPEVAVPKSYKGGLIKNVRAGFFDPETTRFVFDLNHPVQIISSKASSNRLTIEISKSDGKKSDAAIKTPTKPTAPKSPTIKKPEQDIVVKPSAKGEKPMVIIDPGHGGVDPGAIGPAGTKEKDVVLQYAKALKSQLLKTGRYRVKLTREDDRFIMLRKRVEIARKAGANIFISLHADSAPEDSARGLSVYTVSETASDKEAEALAARENKSDVIAGMDLSDERADVADILISLAQRDAKNRSASLADFLVTSLDDRVKLLANAHRFAGFAVLKAPDVPSVLVEIGFLSHPEEEKLLRSNRYRENVVAGIANGIQAYFNNQQKLAGGKP